ncbi:tetratricopeptide repeat protein [Exiguobacterium artemiae]|nr:hypothetical protein [Exiguobacterium sibiricum]
MRLNHFVRQAEFFKLSETPDFVQAKKWLLQALRIEKNHPIANYRLGYLLYREHQYELAVYHFKTALDGTETDVLSETQLMLANTFLVNCGMAITREALRELEDLEFRIEGEIDQERIERYRAEMLVQEENMLDRLYYRKITAAHETIINEEQFYDIRPDKGELLLRSSDDGKTLQVFGKPAESLNLHMFLTLVLLNQKSFQPYPVLQDALSELGGQRISYNYMRQLIRRIRDQFVTLNLIESTSISSPDSSRPVQGFRIHPNWSVTILCRADDFIHPIQKERSDV